MQPATGGKVTLYLDESGDLGFDFTKPKTSRHLTIAFIATTEPEKLKRRVRAVKQRHRISRADELKGYDTQFTIRRELVDQIAKLPLEVHAVTVYKPNVKQELWEDTNILYNYVAGFVLVPFISAQTNVVVVCDERQVRVKTGFDIDAYTRYKVRFEEGKSTAMQFEHVSSVQSHAIQAADIITHAIFRKYESGDHRLANLLASRIKSDKHLFFL